MQYSHAAGLGKDKHQVYRLWEFDSIKELADKAIATPVEDRKSSDKTREDLDFNATASLDEAHHLAVDGWHGIRTKVDAHLEPIRERLGEVLDVVRERMYDTVGSELDIDRYLDGELECMVDDIYQELPRNGKVFTMIIDSSLTWRNDAEDVLKRGAVLCALVEAFDMMGFQLEIFGEWTWRSYDVKGYATVLTRFNHAGEPLDIDSMMFALGSPDWMRRIGFAFGEGQKALHQFGFNGSYYGLNMNGCHMFERVGASSIISLDNNTKMVDDPVAWILDQLAHQGVLVDG